MLFSQRFWDPIRSGEVTLTFRRWKRRQVVAGHRYRTAPGMLEVSSVDIVDPAIISDRDARRSGFTTAAELVGELRGDPGLPTYRIEFRLVDEPDPREVLARQTRLSPDEVAEIDNRLERLDRASRRGSWTRQVLDMIADHPARRAGDLAEMVGRETKPFKTDVRKLKNLGLTISLETGYRLSPRGAAYLDARI